jgi:hypothetical protein
MYYAPSVPNKEPAMQPIPVADLNAHPARKASLCFGIKPALAGGWLVNHVYFDCQGDIARLAFGDVAEAVGICLAIECYNVGHNAGAHASANNHPASHVILSNSKEADGSPLSSASRKGFALWHLASANGVQLAYEACKMSAMGAVCIGGVWAMPDGSIIL